MHQGCLIRLVAAFLGISISASELHAAVGSPSTHLSSRQADSSLVAAAPMGCQAPALSRLKRHKIRSGETVESIARRYDLIPATLMGMNPALRGGEAPIGEVIVVPPYNGIRVELGANQTLRELAKTYNVRPDVLFEVNGCQSKPRVVFVPGVNWSPVTTTATSNVSAIEQIVGGYPLRSKPTKAGVLLGYGWQLQPATGEVAFHSGVDLQAPIGAEVLAAGAGTIAFVGNQGVYGNLLVINHAQGLQTRYAQLGSIKLKVGQPVTQGQVIATVGNSGRPSSKQSHLHFELRSRSNLGWVAEDPEAYLKKLIARK